MILKEALKIMELDEEYDLEQLEKKYSMLLKKYKNKDANKISKEETLEKINTAYKFLINKINGIVDDNKKESFTKRFSEFIYYYKFHMIGSLFLVLLIGYFIGTIVTHKDPDLRVIIQGLFVVENGQVKTTLDKNLETVENTEVDVILLSNKTDSTEDVAYQTKAATLLAANAIDLYILDKFNYDRLADKGFLSDLSKIAKDNNLNSRYLYYGKDEYKEKIYGIDIGESKILKELKIQGSEYIVAVIDRAKYNDNALKVVSEITKDLGVKGYKVDYVFSNEYINVQEVEK